ncbi:hypothetical protein LTR47_010813 [Exophiala xenobiotica]|nr:hypothetical protein LTR41_007597 [Exophiala xenobiotica]KAK5221626.1 hypothetical protein LTR47_010813 [Exophiala xenobiotica]KAK5241467.1 hypothetical protein LTS06_012078 [Exophiala xenobiotica]KAK5259080.1 hypothetical protein LTR40_006654 [Exophiala xenobiotica]
MPTTTRAMARRQQAESTDVQLKHFLALPLEIRTEIYSYTTACPETRHNLMAVSRQISDECTPLIFRQLQFTIHAPYPSALQAGLSEIEIQLAPRCTPDDFDRFYLRRMSAFRLRNIHSLSYNVARPTEDGIQFPRADWSGMEELGRVLLSHSGNLECLEEVVLYLRPIYTTVPDKILRRMDNKKMWHLVNGYGRWDKIERRLVRKGGPLQSWKISRRIDLGDGFRNVGGVIVDHLVEYFCSTFRKTNDNQTSGGSLPVPTLTVRQIN